MEKPYSKYLMLGMKVDDFVNKIRDEIESARDVVSHEANHDWWVSLIKMLVVAKDQNIRFVFEDDGEDSSVYAPKLPDLSAISYSSELLLDRDAWGAAEDDSFNLNKFIRSFYDTKDKKPKAKVTNEQYLKKSGYCPACGSKKTRVDGGLRFENKKKVQCTLGCDDCNAQWSESYVLEGFKDLGSR